MKKILAMDVAYTNIGWASIEPYTDAAVINDVGTIKNPAPKAKTKKSVRDSDLKIERLQRLYRELKELIALHEPDGVIAEIPGGGGKSSKAVAGMAMGTAIVAAAIEELGLAAEWTTERDGKLAVCRRADASKLEMQSAIFKKFPELRKMVPKSKSPKSKSGYEGWFEHSADAIAAYEAAKHGTLVRFCKNANGAFPREAFLF